jgi:hypothetical protein
MAVLKKCPVCKGSGKGDTFLQAESVPVNAKLGGEPFEDKDSHTLMRRITSDCGPCSGTGKVSAAEYRELLAEIAKLKDRRR